MLSHRPLKDAVYQQLARIGKAVASPRRLEILDLLCQAPRTVEALARESSQTLASASQHLKVLRTARLVEADKHGLYVTYRLADDDVCAFLSTLRRLAEARLAEMDRVVDAYLKDRTTMEAVDREVLMERVRRGDVTVLDVRPAEEYRAGHLRGALSVPLSELEARIDSLPADQTVVAYCRGRYCLFAVEAVEMLRSRGFDAVRLEDSVADWRAQGFEVVVE